MHFPWKISVGILFLISSLLAPFPTSTFANTDSLSPEKSIPALHDTPSDILRFVLAPYLEVPTTEALRMTHSLFLHGLPKTLPFDQFRFILRKSHPKLSTGAGQSCFLKADGTAHCLGNVPKTTFGFPIDFSGTPIVFPTPQRLISITTGKSDLDSAAQYSMALTEDGQVYQWGNFGPWRFGDPAYRSATRYQELTALAKRPIPQRIDTPIRFTHLSAGKNHVCGISSESRAWCQGRNSDGQLGSDAFGDQGTFVQVTGDLSFLTLSSGKKHTCAISDQLQLYCWGLNESGQIGDGTTENRFAPTLIAADHLFRAVSAGNDHTCGITTTGALYCWGKNSLGQLGDGTQVQRSVPTLTSTHLLFKKVSSGSSHTCAITLTGEGYCFGNNRGGKLGCGNETSQLTPVRVESDEEFSEIAAGEDETLGITRSGNVLIWGQHSSWHSYRYVDTPEFLAQTRMERSRCSRWFCKR